MEIIPSLLVQSESEFKEQLNGLNGCCDLIQLDIADSLFVPNTTWAEPRIVGEEKQNFELHLMVASPLNEIKKWVNLKNIKRIIIHVETISNFSSISYVLSHNIEIGLALNPATNNTKLEPYLENVKIAMFMGVNPGFQKQSFIPHTLEKIKQFKKDHPNIFVEVDGGVNEDTLPGIIQSGADIICPGSAIFHNERTPEENVKRMKKIINELTF